MTTKFMGIVLMLAMLLSGCDTEPGLYIGKVTVVAVDTSAKTVYYHATDSRDTTVRSALYDMTYFQLFKSVRSGEALYVNLRNRRDLAFNVISSIVVSAAKQPLSAPDTACKPLREYGYGYAK